MSNAVTYLNISQRPSTVPTQASSTRTSAANTDTFAMEPSKQYVSLDLHFRIFHSIGITIQSFGGRLVSSYGEFHFSASGSSIISPKVYAASDTSKPLPSSARFVIPSGQLAEFIIPITVKPEVDKRFFEIHRISFFAVDYPCSGMNFSFNAFHPFTPPASYTNQNALPESLGEVASRSPSGQ